MIPVPAFFSIANVSRRRIACCLATVLGMTIPALVGCGDRSEQARRIQRQQQLLQEEAGGYDHLRETFLLLTRLGESDLSAASGQLSYHLNAWREKVSSDGYPLPTELLASWQSLLPTAQATAVIARKEFVAPDVEHFRSQYLLHCVTQRVLEKPCIDPWLESRVDQVGLTDQSDYQLRVASRLFDWVIRNVQLEPLEVQFPETPSLPTLGQGLTFMGPGYRQTTWEALWRGSADGLRRADIFLQLCRHANLPACLLSVPSQTDPQGDPWLCAVVIAGEAFLFDTQLGLPIPGANERGIATLTAARRDPSILRRLRVAGFFDYPLSSTDIQQTIALINATPELLSHRMRLLSESFAGDQRINLHIDAQTVADAFTQLSGISTARLWTLPLLARQYAQAVQDAMRDNIALAQWYYVQYGMFDELGALGRARWRHLEGSFDNIEEEDLQGARVLYMDLRRPEFELADLRLNVRLQKEYALERQRGETEEVYQRRIAFIQNVLRETKRTATFWLGQMHFEEQRWETAEKWMDGRVLQDPAAARWHPLARYHLARIHEQLGQPDQAERLLKTAGDVQEQGNRIRARLLLDASKSER